MNRDLDCQKFARIRMDWFTTEHNSTCWSTWPDVSSLSCITKFKGYLKSWQSNDSKDGTPKYKLTNNIKLANFQQWKQQPNNNILNPKWPINSNLKFSDLKKGRKKELTNFQFFSAYFDVQLMPFYSLFVVSFIECPDYP